MRTTTTTVTAFACRCGGVGRTTLANLAAIVLAKKGCRVLLVDTDPQVYASFLLGNEAALKAAGTYALLMGKSVTPLKAATPNLEILPAHLSLEVEAVRDLSDDETFPTASPLSSGSMYGTTRK